jgi:cell division protein ZipA
MNELRWILLAAGVLLIAGIYFWGLRARRRSAAPEPDRMTRVEPARTVAVLAEPHPSEPEAPVEEPRFDEADYSVADEYDQPPAARRPPGTIRREPRIEPRFDSPVEQDTSGARLEPRLEPQEPQATEPRHPEPSPAATRKPPRQKIVALRVVAPPGAQFEGARLLEALLADGFSFGRYDVFHRLDAAGRPLVSLASLKEPGTFDPDSMPGAQFRGVALFAVMPGPLPGLQAFDELIVTARALAETLGGHLQDERGGPLSLQRLSQQRDEVTDFERARAASPGA